MAHIQDVRRSVTLPPIPAQAPDWFQAYARQWQLLLSQQLQAVHSSFEAREFAITAAVVLQTVTWTTPAPDATYIVLCTPNWNTTVWVTNRTITTVDLNFGTAAPANAVAFTLRVR